MKIKIIALLLSVSLGGCGYYHEKMAERYVKKAEKISLASEASSEEIDSVYEYLSKALDHKHNIPKVLEISERTAQASAAGGYMKPSEMNLELVNKYLRLNPAAWQVYLNLISAYSIKGDLINLESLITKLYSVQNKIPPEERITLKVLTAICQFNLMTWLQSEGYLSVNSGADKLLSNLNRYADYVSRAKTIKEEIKKEETSLASVEREITYAYEISMNEAFKDEKEISKILKLYELSRQDSNYLKAVKYAADGNAFLSKKEYSNARIYYKAALSNYPALINAKKQLIETDFQEAMSEALNQKNTSGLKETLYDCYQEINDMIQENSSAESAMPFVTAEKFLSEAYSLKAAILTALMTLEENSAKKERIKSQIDAALNKAIELYPKNKMAKDIFDRIRKDGR
ncbi:MAG: hypothetical protein GX447_04225 [Elusimicrobia bacterium]|nr:hypothetical protein [Elusimicrobiota bacterium]